MKSSLSSWVCVCGAFWVQKINRQTWGLQLPWRGFPSLPGLPLYYRVASHPELRLVGFGVPSLSPCEGSDFSPISPLCPTGCRTRSALQLPESQDLVISLGPEEKQWGPPGRGASLASRADPRGFISRIRPYVLINPTFGSQGGEAYRAWLMPWLNSPPEL